MVEAAIRPGPMMVAWTWPAGSETAVRARGRKQRQGVEVRNMVVIHREVVCGGAIDE